MITLNKTNFDTVLSDSKPILVDFWAPWCGPCLKLAPKLEALAQQYADKMAVGKVNVDDEPELAQRFKVSSIPTILVLKMTKDQQEPLVLGQLIGNNHEELMKLFETTTKLEPTA